MISSYKFTIAGVILAASGICHSQPQSEAPRINPSDFIRDKILGKWVTEQQMCPMFWGIYHVQTAEDTFARAIVHQNGNVGMVESALLIKVADIKSIGGDRYEYTTYSTDTKGGTGRKEVGNITISEITANSWRHYRSQTLEGTVFVDNGINLNTQKPTAPVFRCDNSEAAKYLMRLNSAWNTEYKLSQFLGGAPINRSSRLKIGDAIPSNIYAHPEKDEYARVFFRANCGTKLAQDFEVLSLPQHDPNTLYGIDKNARNQRTGNYEKRILCIGERSEMDAKITSYIEAEKRQVTARAEQIQNNKSGYTIDTVAKVLNYSSGYDDEGSDTWGWVATDQAKCVYALVNFQDKTVIKSMSLNSMDPKSIKVVTMQRSFTDRGLTGRQNIQRTIQTQDVQYMGQSIFSQEGIDRDRLQRGWTLIYSKFCKGTAKEF